MLPIKPVFSASVKGEDGGQKCGEKQIPAVVSLGV